MSWLARVFATVAIAVCTNGCSDETPEISALHVARCRSFSDETPRWLIDGDTIGRSFLDAYCAGVGPGLLLRADAPSSTAPDTLVVVNWNMALGEGRLDTLVDDLRSGVLTGRRTDHFVLLLQEAPRSDASVPSKESLPAGAKVSELDMFGSTDIVEFARAHRLHLLYVPSMRNGTDAREDQGNAILSTLPLRDPEVYELPAGIRRRVAVSAVVEWAGEDSLRLVSAHLDNWSPQALLGSLGSVRAHQARVLAAMLPADGALLLGADLNTWTRGVEEAAFRTLRRVFPQPDTIDLRPTATRLARGRKLDYLLLRGPAAWHFVERRINDRYGSDHNPIIGLLHIRSGY